MTPYPLIDIHVNYFEEGGFWLVNAQSYQRPEDPDCQPDPYQDSYTVKDGLEAEAGAKAWAEAILNFGEANKIVVFKDGNEVACLIRGK